VKLALTGLSHWHEKNMTPVTYLLAPATRTERIANAISVGAQAVDVGNAKNSAVIKLVESAARLLSLERICSHPLITRIAFGSADLRDLGCEDASETLQFARSQVVFHSAAANLL
jgi:citrate lyase beta subunit